MEELLEKEGPKGVEDIMRHTQLIGAMSHNFPDNDACIETFAKDYHRFCINEQMNGAGKSVIAAAKGLVLTTVFGLSAMGLYTDYDNTLAADSQKTEQQVAVKSNEPFRISPFAPLTLISAVGMVYAVRRFKEAVSEFNYTRAMRPIRVAGLLEEIVKAKAAKEQHVKE